MLRFSSMPYSNPHVKSIFSQMNHLWTNYRNRMDIQLVAAELKIRNNSNIPRNNFYKSIISQQNLLKAIATNNKLETRMGVGERRCRCEYMSEKTKIHTYPHTL